MTDCKNNNKNNPHDTSSRRSFLSILWTVLGIAAVGELIAVVVTFLKRGKTRKALEKSEDIIEAGYVDSFQVDSVTANIQGRFYLCRMEDGGFLALSSKCTHLGCTVPWEEKEKRFACPCHGSSFDMMGRVVTSPAPRPLDMYPVRIENNVVKVNVEKSIRRAEYSKDQLVYAQKGRS